MTENLYEFRLPDVGEGIHEAEISQWLVTEGDIVSLNQPILEIQTDKAVVEIPAPVAGLIAEIKVDPGVIAYVGDTLVLIRPARAIAQRETPIVQEKTLIPATGGIAGPGKRILAAPAVRKLALELGVDLAQVKGSGPAGRVLPSDVRQHVAKRTAPDPALPARLPPPPSANWQNQEPVNESLDIISVTSEEEPLHGIQRRMAQRLEMAWRTIPHVTVLEEVNATNLIELRRQLKPEAEQRGVNLTYLPFVIKAVVQALKEFPYFNASLDMDAQKIIKHREYHIGIATDTPAGLLMPVVKHADRATVTQLAATLTMLAARARERKLTLEELSGSTFSITNFGSFGTTQATPIINPPEVAILGCGVIAEKPIAVSGQLVVQPVMPLALSFDHRLLDGATAAQFMNRIKALLSTPTLLFLEMI
jgi:pyruvate dehydrogenase E2 component (dihydrolipoamide acetyltransferase)